MYVLAIPSSATVVFSWESISMVMREPEGCFDKSSNIYCRFVSSVETACYFSFEYGNVVDSDKKHCLFSFNGGVLNVKGE